MANMADTDPTVEDLMTRSPVVIADDAPVVRVAQLLADNAIAGVPVVDEDGRSIGVISETDLLRARAGIVPWTGWRGLLVRDLMTSPAQTVAASASFAEAARLMTSEHIHRLVVVDADLKPIGILSQGDIVREMADER